MIVALIVLNLAGGDGLEDLERLEQDAGFVQVMREVERRLLPRADCRAGALAQASAARPAVALGDVAGPVPRRRGRHAALARQRDHPGDG